MVVFFGRESLEPVDLNALGRLFKARQIPRRIRRDYIDSVKVSNGSLGQLGDMRLDTAHVRRVSGAHVGYAVHREISTRLFVISLRPIFIPFLDQKGILG